MKRSIMTALMVLSLGTIGVYAEDGATLYAACAACHGEKGELKALDASKIIKDMSKADFTTALKGYKAGTYGGAQKESMQPQAATLSDAQIKALADYIAK